MVLANLSNNREMSVNAIAGSVRMSQSALSQHLAKLRLAGMVNARRDGKEIYYFLSRDARSTVLLPFLRALFKF